MKTILLLIISSFWLVACGPPNSISGEKFLKTIDEHMGKRVTIRAKFKSGARCSQDAKEWKTYCKDCQYCKGPLVIDTGLDLKDEGMVDWPLILGGTYDGKDIRCKGALGKIECYPFKPGKTYVVQGLMEANRPPKLLVKKFWEVNGS